MKKFIRIIFCFLFIPIYPLQIPSDLVGPVDFIIFSYNRPLQLFAYLESIQRHCSGVGKIFVLYRTSDKQYMDGYKKLQRVFRQVQFIKQRKPSQDFKPLLCDIMLKKSLSPYVAFGVDDIVVCDAVNLYQCVESLEETKALGFYLRLGKNITQSYMAGTTCNVPLFNSARNNVFMWNFSANTSEWNYPHTLDMTIFRKAYAQNAVLTLNYNSPNIFESQWWGMRASTDAGICFEHSKIVNIPLNLVQQDCHNNNIGILSPELLLKLFNAGLKMDIDKLLRYENNSPHMHYIPSFKLRLFD